MTTYFASSRAVILPIPVLVPVTIATWPVKSGISLKEYGGERNLAILPLKMYEIKRGNKIERNAITIAIISKNEGRFIESIIMKTSIILSC